MNNTRIKTAFDCGKAFVPCVTAGYPSLEDTDRVVRAAVAVGADLVKIAVPFSDPTAEGPIMQRACAAALESGTRTDDVLDLVADLRADVSVPIVLSTYANVPFCYGTQQFLNRCREVGVDGLVIPDVPLEESAEFAPQCAASGIALIRTVAPTSKNRIEAIASGAPGFIYVMASLGGAGIQADTAKNVEAMLQEVRSHTDIPCVVGTGITTPEQAQQLGSLADGIAVGSALMELVGKTDPEHLEESVGRYVTQMKAAL
ncbi:tryptophan synthase subunit alpha [Gleimia hominis]|uniref:tryptophan synthase subunit alpha n=1 Tax=Gleimia hominis TaxID=595468 RepID=UPI000C80FD05|nr:tryptophan synthase subunit alpha [Gleimia hominis]WIK64885.1 tryptophan synthase subunit alpha [Gleimia hominis]